MQDEVALIDAAVGTDVPESESDDSDDLHNREAEASDDLNRQMTWTVRFATVRWPEPSDSQPSDDLNRLSYTDEAEAEAPENDLERMRMRNLTFDGFP